MSTQCVSKIEVSLAMEICILGAESPILSWGLLPLKIDIHANLIH